MDSLFGWKRAILIFIFAAVEAAGWLGFILLAWLGFSVAVLLGVAVLILYTMNFTWAVSLKEHMDTCTQRILKAIEVSGQTAISEESADEPSAHAGDQPG